MRFQTSWVAVEVEVLWKSQPREGKEKKKGQGGNDGRGRERRRKIPERYSLIRWSVEKRYAVLEFGPFCCTRGERLVCDFNRRISKSPCCVPLRPVFHGDNSTDPIHATSTWAIGIIFQPRRRIRQKRRPRKIYRHWDLHSLSDVSGIATLHIDATWWCTVSRTCHKRRFFFLRSILFLPDRYV